MSSACDILAIYKASRGKGDGLRWSDLALDHDTLCIHQETVHVSGFSNFDLSPKTRKAKKTFPVSNFCVKLSENMRNGIIRKRQKRDAWL